MVQYLKQSTATVVELGPFADKTDGVTLEEAITVTNLTVSLFKQIDTLPADIITNGAFGSDTGWTKGTNWQIAAGVADQSSPSASDIEQTPSTALVENQAYEVTYTVASRTAGAIVVKIGGTSGTSRTTNATFTEIIVAGSGSLIEFTADGTWDGSIDDVTLELSHEEITPAASGSDNDMVFADGGTYYFELSVANTGILGRLKLVIEDVSDLLPRSHEFMVVTANVFDSMFGSDNLDVSVTQWLGTAVTLSTGNKPDVNVDEWADVLLATTNPLPNAAADAAGGVPISDAGGLDLDAMNTAAVRLTAVRAAVLTDWIDAGRLDTLLDAIPTTAMRGTDSAFLAASAPTNFSSLVISGGGVVDSSLEQIQGAATGAVSNFKNEYDGTQSFSGSYIRHQTATAGTASTITLDAGAPTTVDIFKDCPIAIVGGTGIDQQRWITAYSSGRVATVERNWDTNPDATSVFSIGRSLGGSLFNIEADAAEILVDTGTTLDGKLNTIDDFLDTEIAAILVDTGTTLPNLIGTPAADLAADIAAIPTTAMRGTDSAALASVCTETRLAELDAGNLPSTTDNILTDTAVIGALGAGLTDLGGMSATMKAQINTEVDTAFTTQMADSVPADGTISTREQAIYALLQILTEFSISGTTLTVKKVDGSTTLMTFDIGDDTNPTSITRLT